MLWVLIAVLALACCAVLYAASRGTGRDPGAGEGATGPGASADDPHTRFYRDQLAGLERDAAQGRLDAAELAAARAELAREFLRQTRDEESIRHREGAGRVVLMAVPLVALLSFGLYAAIGQAGLPARPLAERTSEAAEARQTLETAMAQVEARLEQDPDDVRGWQVLAPIYLDQARYGEAVNAYRRVLDLAPVTADTQTDLAQALILSGDEGAQGEAVALLESASERDSEHVRSRFFLASVLTQQGAFERAVPVWTRLLDIALGNEPWIAAAQSGLATAQAGAFGARLDSPVESGADEAMIVGMVEGLAARLYTEGGSAEEWSRLVQSRLVFGDRESAASDFARGLEALDGADREALRAYGESEGLTQEEAQD